jgi:hypothetical protein
VFSIVDNIVKHGIKSDAGSLGTLHLMRRQLTEKG